MGKAPTSDKVKKIVRAEKGHEMVALARQGGGTLDVNGKTYRIRRASKPAEDDDKTS